MMCYKDRTYCANEDCVKFKSCPRSYAAALEEKKKSPDPFIRDGMPVSVTQWEKCMITGEEYEKAEEEEK